MKYIPTTIPAIPSTETIDTPYLGALDPQGQSQGFLTALRDTVRLNLTGAPNGCIYNDPEVDKYQYGVSMVSVLGIASIAFGVCTSYLGTWTRRVSILRLFER